MTCSQRSLGKLTFNTWRAWSTRGHPVWSLPIPPTPVAPSSPENTFRRSSKVGHPPVSFCCFGHPHTDSTHAGITCVFSVASRHCVPILADEIYGDMVSVAEHQQKSPKRGPGWQLDLAHQWDPFSNTVRAGALELNVGQITLASAHGGLRAVNKAWEQQPTRLEYAGITGSACMWTPLCVFVCLTQQQKRNPSKKPTLLSPTVNKVPVISRSEGRKDSVDEPTSGMYIEGAGLILGIWADKGKFSLLLTLFWLT